MVTTNQVSNRGIDAKVQATWMRNIGVSIVLMALLLSPIGLLNTSPRTASTGGFVGLSSAKWCSLYEGDGVSDPSAEGWYVRPYSGTTITAGFSDGATVAMVDDSTPYNGAWMQRFMDFEQPFVISVRGRYDPSTTLSDFVTLINVFTGNHSIGLHLYPTHMVIGAVPSLDLPAVKGTWYNVTFDARAPLDVDVLIDGTVVANVEMYPTDLIIWDQPLNKPGLYAIGTGLDQTAAGMVDYIRTTMCPPNEIPPKHPDRIPPEIRNVTFDDGVQAPSNILTVPYGTVSKVWLNATIDDSRMKNSTIWSVNYSKIPRTWPGIRMYPVDGKLDWPVEDVTAQIDISSFQKGTYGYCVYARDYQGPKNLTGGCGTLIISEVLYFKINATYLQPGCNEGDCAVHFEIETNDQTLIAFRWNFTDDGQWDTPWLTDRAIDKWYNDNYGGRVCAQGTDGAGKLVFACTGIEVKNVPPTVDAGPDMTVDEASSFNVTFRFSDPGYDSPDGSTWENFTATIDWGYGQSEAASVNEVPGSRGTPTTGTVEATHVYGDNGVFEVTVTMCDDDGGCGNDTMTVTVDNLPPTLVSSRIFMVANITLRVAGEKWHDVILKLYEDGQEVGWVQVVRYPGSPNDQMATVHNVEITLDRNFSAVAYYTPDDDSINGQPNGATPAWLIIRWENGMETRLHHTFNVRHDKTWIWIVDNFRIFAVNQRIYAIATASDPGSDDLTFTWDWADGTPAIATTYFNDGVGPDPYPSPGGTFPFTAADEQTHTLSTPGTYEVVLRVTDDDGGSTEIVIVLLIS